MFRPPVTLKSLTQHWVEWLGGAVGRCAVGGASKGSYVRNLLERVSTSSGIVKDARVGQLL